MSTRKKSVPDLARLADESLSAIAPITDEARAEES